MARFANILITCTKRKRAPIAKNHLLRRVSRSEPRGVAELWTKKLSAAEGTKVKAMLDGIVTLSEKNLYYTGGTIIFDHGHGVSTLYMHMKDIYVKNGESIKQGDVIGTVGKTGRATGAHLDIRLNWFDAKLDPDSVLRK